MLKIEMNSLIKLFNFPKIKTIIFSILFFLGLLFPAPKSFAEKKLKIAIIPFTNLSGKTENDWIGAGFSETMVTALSNLKNVQITERFLMNQVLKEISFQQSGFIDDRSLVKVGKLTGANIIISGSFQIANTEIVVNSRFIDLEKGTVENGSGMYIRGEVAKIFDLEEKLAQQFNQKFSLIPTEQEDKNMKSVIYSTNSVKANKLYLKARGRYMNGGFNGKKEAIDILKEAINLDPNYALALALLGEIEIEYFNTNKIFNEVFRVNQNVDSFYKDGLNHIKKAVSLAPGSFEVNRSMAKILILDKKEKEAQLFLNKALAIKSDDVSSIIIQAFSNKENQLDYINKALEIDKFNYEVYFAYGRYYLYYNEKPDYEKAVSNLLKSVELNPYSWEANMQLVQAYMRAKDFTSAIAWAERMILMEKDVIGYIVAASAYLGSGNLEKIKELYIEIDKMVDTPFVKTILVGFYIRDNDYKSAFTLAKNGLEKYPDDAFLNQVISQIYSEHFNNCKFALYHMKLFLKNLDKIWLPPDGKKLQKEMGEKRIRELTEKCGS